MDINQVFALLIVIGFGYLLIKGLPKNTLIDPDFNCYAQFIEFEQFILESVNPDYDQIEREIEVFRVEHEGKVDPDILSGYVVRLKSALDELEHGISYS